MGKNFDETLAYLGSGYIKAHDDIEEIIFRDTGRYQIEISGLNSSGRYDATIYVWENKKRIIQSIQDIASKEELAKHLETVFQALEAHQD